MIEAHFEGGTRYRMLETLRAFGLDRLAAAGEEDAATGRLLRWAVELTREIGAALVTEREPEADAALRRELPNLRAAWRSTGSPVPGWSGRPTRGGTWCCLAPLSVVALARGAYAEAVEHSSAAAALVSRPVDSLGIAALALAYPGDPDRARTLNERGLAGAASPSMRAWGAYVAGEIETAAGRREAAEPHYVRAIDLARASGPNFLVGVATVGLVAARAATGRVSDALVGYRDVIDYFARTGNWTHQWVALRNLADLLRRLGDDEPAALLDAASDRAPDAPADRHRPGPSPAPEPPLPGRAAVLALARGAIERNLARS